LEISINTSELYDILEYTPATQNIMLTGAHGIGKSQILTKYYEGKGIKVVTLFLGQMSDPGDLIGLPKFNEETGLTEFKPPYWFPIDGKPVVLFLDELNRARDEILQTIMDLALNRKLAGHELPQGSRIISAVNAGENYQVTDLDPALVSRFNIYRFKPTVEDWLSWAKKEKIDDRIIAYIKTHPSKLDEFVPDEDNNLKKSPDRRGWVKVSEVITQIKKLSKSHLKMIAGIIGDDTAIDFISFASQFSESVTGYTVLAEGKECFEKVDSLKVPDYSAVINTMLENLNTANQKIPVEQKQWAENTKDFFNHIYHQNLDEVIAYFISALSEKKNINAKLFFMEHCKDEAQIIKNFILEKKLNV